MSNFSPINRALLDARLLNADDESVLRIGDGPQKLTLELVNRTRHDIGFGDQHGTELALTLRAGAFDHPDSAKVTTPGWTLTPGQTQEFPLLVLTSATSHRLAPGDTLAIEIAGLVPSGSGGSRATRVSLEYRNVHVPGADPITGRRTLHLAILHDEAKTGPVLGNSGSAGPIQAEIISSADVIRGDDSQSIRLRLSATKPTFVAGDPTGETVGRIHVGFPTHDGDNVRLAGVPWSPINLPGPWWNSEAGGNVLRITNTANFPMRMLKVNQTGEPIFADEITVGSRTVSALIPPGVEWQIVDNMNAPYIVTDARSGAYLKLIPDMQIGASIFSFDGTRESGNDWDAAGLSMKFNGADDSVLSGQFLEFDISILSNLVPGLYPLRLRYENIGDRDGEIVVMVNVTSMGQPGLVADVGRINAPRSLEINTPKTHIHHAVEIGGELTIKGDNISFTDNWHMGRQSNWFFFRNPKSKSFFYMQDNDKDVEVGQNVGKPLNIRSRQNVGINKSDPGHTLDVNGDIAANRLYLARGWHISVTNGGTQLLFYKDNTRVLVVTETGKVWSKSGEHVGKIS